MCLCVCLCVCVCVCVTVPKELFQGLRYRDGERALTMEVLADSKIRKYEKEEYLSVVRQQ